MDNPTSCRGPDERVLPKGGRDKRGPPRDRFGVNRARVGLTCKQGTDPGVTLTPGYEVSYDPACAACFGDEIVLGSAGYYSSWQNEETRTSLKSELFRVSAVYEDQQRPSSNARDRVVP